MSQLYVAGFDTRLIGAMSVVVGGTIGSGTATITPGTYAHATFDTSTDASAALYTDFPSAVVAALEAAVPAGVWTCSLSTTTRRYIIGCSDFFTLTWTGVAGLYLKNALGFTSNVASTDEAEGTVTPYYLIAAEVDGQSDVSGVYEPDDVASEAVSDGGTDFGVSKDTDELWSDWTQAMEPLAAVFTREASATVPWTWQDFWKHCRNDQPFAVASTASFQGTVHRLRAGGASFKPVRVVTDYDGLWNLRFETRDLGTMSL